MTDREKFREALLAENEYFEDRVERDTETNRKGFVKLHLRTAVGEPLTNATVELTQKTHDFDFGCNLFMLDQYDSAERNAQYQAEFKKLFNMAVLPFYWEGTEPQEGVLRYSNREPDCYRRPPVDRCVEFCREQDLRMKGHPLFWHEFVPHWLPTEQAPLKRLLVRRFREIAERYADIIPAFDVVNEPSRVFDCNQRPADKAWHLSMEDDYCPWIFRLAEQYFPANTLFLNDTVGAAFYDYRGEASAYYQQIRSLLNRGVRIDAIGMQCHLGSTPGFRNVMNPKRLYSVLDTYGKLDRPIHISEISFPSVFGGVQDEELQALLAERLYRVAFSHKAVRGIVWWNLPDDGISTNKAHAFENLPSGALLDGHYREKESYRTLYHLIHEKWQSRETLKSHARDYVTARVFYGNYAVQVNGVELPDIRISETGLDELTLTMPE